MNNASTALGNVYGIYRVLHVMYDVCMIIYVAVCTINF